MFVIEVLKEIINYKQFWTILSGILTLVPVLIKVLGYLFSTHKKSQKETIENDNIIDNQVSDLKHQTDSSAVFVFKYHNGGITYDGKPMEKMTMYYPRDNNNIVLEVNKFSNIHITFFGGMVCQLYKHGEIWQDEVLKSNDELKDNRYRTIMNSLNISSHYAIAVFKDKWKINFKWNSFGAIFFPFKKEKIMIASIHWVLDVPYNQIGKNTELRLREIDKNKINGKLIAEQIKNELLK